MTVYIGLFKWRKMALGRVHTDVNFIHFYSLYFLLLLFYLLYMCQTNSHYLRITIRKDKIADTTSHTKVTHLQE